MAINILLNHPHVDNRQCRLNPPLKSALIDMCSSMVSRLGNSDITMRSEIDATLYIIKNLEGGYANLSGDRGGETIFGVASNFNRDAYNHIVNYLSRGEFTSALDEAWSCYSQYTDQFIDNLFSRGLNHSGLFLLSLKLWGYPYRLLIKHIQKEYNSIYSSSLDIDGVIGPLSMGRLAGLSDEGVAKLILSSLYDQSSEGFIAKFLEFCDKYPMFRSGFINRVLKSGPLVLTDCFNLGINVQKAFLEELCFNGNYSDGIVSYSPYNSVIGFVNNPQIVSSIQSERFLFSSSIIANSPAICQLRLADFEFDSNYKHTADLIAKNIYD